MPHRPINPHILQQLRGHKPRLQPASLAANDNPLQRQSENLCHAIQAENYGAVKKILATRFDQHYQDEDGNSLLHLAAQQQNTAIIRLLVAAGLDANGTNKWGESPLHSPIRNNNQAHIEALLPAMAADWRNHDGDTLLHFIAAQDAVEYAPSILAHGVPLHAVNKHGFAALHLAARDGKTAMLRWLANAEGAVIDMPSPTGITPTMLAARNGQLGALRHLLSLGAFVNNTDQSGNTALHYAAEHGRDAAIGMLREFGARADLPNMRGEFPAHLIAQGINDNADWLRQGAPQHQRFSAQRLTL